MEVILYYLDGWVCGDVLSTVYKTFYSGGKDKKKLSIFEQTDNMFIIPRL